MHLSLRSVTMLCISGCIVLTAIISLVVAVRSTDVALDKTNTGQIKVVDKCFEQHLTKTVDSYADVMAERSVVVVQKVQNMLDVAKSAQRDAVAYMDKHDPTKVDDWDELLIGLNIMLDLFATREVTVFGFSRPNGVGWLFSTALDNTQGVDNINKNSIILYNDGTEGKTGSINYNTNSVYDGPCDYSQLSKGTSGLCPVTGVNFSRVTDQQKIPVVIGETKWIDTQASMTFSGFSLVSVITTVLPTNQQNPVFGSIFTTLTLGTITSLLETLQQHNSERIFIVSSGNLKGSQRGLLVGASSGKVTETVFGNDPYSTATNVSLVKQIRCFDSDDVIVAGTCRSTYAMFPNSRDPFNEVLQLQSSSGSAQVMDILNSGNDTLAYSVWVANLSDGYGLDWWVVVGINQRMIVGEVETQRRNANEEIRKTKDDTDSVLEVDRAVLFGTVAGTACLLVVLAFLAASYVTQPLERLSWDMHNVAELRLDSVSTLHDLSILAEVYSMEKSFRTMLAAMIEYRQYLPDGFGIVDNDESDADEASEVKTEALSNSSGTRSKNLDLRYTYSQDSSTVLSRKRHMSGDTVMLRISQHGFTDLSLTPKKAVSHVSVGNRDFLNFITEKRDPSFIVEYHSVWLLAVISEAKPLRGCVERFVGDNIDFTFGAHQSCTMPSTKATNFCLNIRDSVGTVVSEFLNSKSIRYSIDSYMVVGVATGTTLCGNLGCQGFKAPSTLGQSITLAKGMQTVAREIGLDIVLDERTIDDITGFISMPVDILYHQSKHTKITCYYLRGKHEHDGDAEWMYAMQGSDTESAYGRAWGSLRAGDLQDALSQMVDMETDDIVCRVARRLQIYIDDVLAITGESPNEYLKMQTAANLPSHIADKVECSNITDDPMPAYIKVKVPIPHARSSSGNVGINGVPRHSDYSRHAISPDAIDLT